MAIPFTSVILQAEGMKATGVPVPEAVVAALGSAKNAPVTVTLRAAGSTGDWYTYRTSIATRNGSYIMSFSSANRDASGLGAGDAVEVTVELDTTPRTVQLPEDLTSALTSVGGLDAFLALSYSRRRRYVDPVEAAKSVDTRQRRIEKIIDEFGGS
jgi:hypothetical protein